MAINTTPHQASQMSAEQLYSAAHRPAVGNEAARRLAAISIETANVDCDLTPEELRDTLERVVKILNNMKGL